MGSLFAVAPGAFSRGPDPRLAVVLLWTVIAIALAFLLWPGGRGRRLARQIFAVAVLGFREGVRLKVLWTVFALALIPGALAYYSDADGTHVGRASLILNYCLSTGEVLGAALIVLLSALSVAREIESRIMHTFGTKPVPRWAILAGKALGFWTIDLLFLLGVTIMAAVLVRAVPAREETRHEGLQLSHSGTWEDLRRDVLTTRQFRLSDEDTDPTIPTYKMTRPAKTSRWFFTLDPVTDRGEPLAVRFHLSSSRTFAPEIERVGLTVAYENSTTPLFTRTGTVPQDRPFDVFIALPDGPMADRLVVSLAAPDSGRFAPSVVGTVRLGATLVGHPVVPHDGRAGRHPRAGRRDVAACARVDAGQRAARRHDGPGARRRQRRAEDGDQPVASGPGALARFPCSGQPGGFRRRGRPLRLGAGAGCADGWHCARPRLGVAGGCVLPAS
ncbi:MAG: ABC transporter permease [Planctomycetota bacterium]|nr:ABC transporter permease [Planctomycetota bacterium]